MKRFGLCAAIILLPSCASGGRTVDPVFLDSGFRSPARIREALGVLPEQLMQGGHLYERYRVGDEIVEVQYHRPNTPSW